MWALTIFIILCEFPLKENEIPNKFEILLPHLLIMVVSLFVFRWVFAVQIVSQIALDMLVQTLLYTLNPHLAYTFSMSTVLFNLQSLSISEKHLAFYGCVAIFMIPIYLFYWGFATTKIHYAILYALLKSSIWPIPAYL